MDLALRTAYNLTSGNLTWGKAALKTLEEIAKPILSRESKQEYPPISGYVENIKGFLERWKLSVLQRTNE